MFAALVKIENLLVPVTPFIRSTCVYLFQFSKLSRNTMFEKLRIVIVAWFGVPMM